ncbi:hypothetical protein GYMLUDRAFT_133009, partial [Collybiopsis luxurians FD-317 M1]
TSDTEEDNSDEQHAFCPDIHREKIIQMMVNHLNAHPMIPGYSVPTRDRIRYWAVKEMYLYCVKNELREVWVYMWENWYRPGRWELWAHSVHKDLPVLQTTMMVEAHWCKIKNNFLHHFHKPCVDFLIWILTAKLAPIYYQKL